MKMHDEALVFYAFHNNPGLTSNRLINLLAINPHVHIIACYGGDSTLFEKTVTEICLQMEQFAPGLSNKIDFVCSLVSEPWYNIDLLPIDWFARYGHNYCFDYLLYLEYDVLLLEPVKRVLSLLGDFDFASCLTDSEKTPDWDWLKRSSYSRFLAWRKLRYGIPERQKIFNAFAPIHILSRNALEKYASLYIRNEIPAVFIEIRLPNVIDLLGCKIIDAGFDKTVRWRPAYSKDEINTKLQSLGTSCSNSMRVFHPFYDIWNVYEKQLHI